MSILVDENTTFIIQGITGREAVNMTRECLDYGSKVVGGVTPGRGGRDVYGVPVYDTVREITSKERVDGSVLTVPPAFVRDAAFEALENGIRLLVIVTERVPRAEVAQIVEFADMKGARIIGPNCLGIISPGKSKMGGIGGPAANTNQAYRPGQHRRYVAQRRHGDRDLELAHRRRLRPEHDRQHRRRRDHRLDLRRADAVLRGRPRDARHRHLLRARRPDGGAARRVGEANNSRLPIIAFMAGRFMDAMPGMRFGHAGTIVEGKQDTASEKIRRLDDAGISVAEEIAQIPELVKQRLS